MPECNHPKPPYYDAANGVTLESIVRGFDLPPYLAWTVKYIIRAGRKRNRLRDLKKARECLDREILYLESAPAVTISECRCRAVALAAAPCVSQADGAA